MTKNNLKHLGFTLIELLVVIAIIGIVMSIGVANFVTAQKQARDSSRQQIIHNIQTAFEQYYASNSSYPSSDPSLAFDNNTLPTDPKNSDEYVINYNFIDADSYCVCATLEAAVGNASAPSSSACSWSTSGTNYCAENKQ